jgi:REP element-mobilizing transposase RayT
MSDTYTQLYIQFVFAVKYRKAMLDPAWDERLRLYITAIVQNNRHKMLAINNIHDHIHILIGLNPGQSISKIMQLVKGESSQWINKEKLTEQTFQWQNGYGAFSYSRSHLDRVVKYIHNQKEHHRKQAFLDEYRFMLERHCVEYDEQNIFIGPIN